MKITFVSLLAVVALVVGNCYCKPFAPEYTMRQHNDPELTAGFFEGDMVIDVARTGIRNESYRWPNNTVYYKFFTQFDDDHRNQILRGMRILEEVSCIRFQEASDEQTYYVNITGLPGGCFSTVGWYDRPQNYNLEIYPLDTGCFRMGTVVHEFLHTLGFYHMQSASNRDDYVRIVKENIIPTAIHNFNKYNDNIVDDMGEEYDYGSVMHYSAYAFSANGEMTIVPNDLDAASAIGQRRSMSQSDINRLNIMYRCPIKAK